MVSQEAMTGNDHGQLGFSCIHSGFLGRDSLLPQPLGFLGAVGAAGDLKSLSGFPAGSRLGNIRVRGPPPGKFRSPPPFPAIRGPA